MCLRVKVFALHWRLFCHYLIHWLLRESERERARKRACVQNCVRKIRAPHLSIFDLVVPVFVCVRESKHVCV